MSTFGSVSLPGFWDDSDAKPYADVAHSYDGRVRLTLGPDYESAHATELTVEQARGLAEALLAAARLAEDKATAASWWQKATSDREGK